MCRLSLIKKKPSLQSPSALAEKVADPLLGSAGFRGGREGPIIELNFYKMYRYGWAWHSCVTARSRVQRPPLPPGMEVLCWRPFGPDLVEEFACSARVNVSLLKNGLGFLDSTERKVCVNQTNEYKTFMKWLLLTTTSHYVKMKTNERDCVCVGWGEHNVQVIYKSSKYRLTRGLKN